MELSPVRVSACAERFGGAAGGVGWFIPSALAESTPAHPAPARGLNAIPSVASSTAQRRTILPRSLQRPLAVVEGSLTKKTSMKFGCGCGPNPPKFGPKFWP